MRPHFTRKAECDLGDIADFVAKSSQKRAISFIRDLRQQCDRIALQPQLYRLRADLPHSIRICAFRKYLILFTFSGSKVVIVRIIHSARDIFSLL